MKRLFKSLTALAITIPISSQAAFFSGNELLRRINSNESTERLVALGFVMGVHDSFDGEIICSGSQVTSGQVRDVVKQYLEINPSRRDLGAATLTLFALANAFPCQAKKTDPKKRS